MKANCFIVLFLLSTFYLKAQDTTKVLFLGNSFTYYNNMPDLVKGLADSAGIVTEMEMYAPGGMYVYTTTSMTGHDSSAVTESYIYSKDWDYIVVQDNQGGYVWSQGYINSMIVNGNVVLYDKIKNYNQCTRIVYFAGWAMEGGLPSSYWNDGGLNITSETTQSCIARIYNQYVHLNNTLFNEIVTPIGLAWNTCLNTYPSVELHGPDGVHSSLAGSYLAASTIFSTIFKTDPTNFNFNGGLNDTLATYLRQTGYNTVITDSVFFATNLNEYTPEIIFNPDEISGPDNYSSYQWVLDNNILLGADTNPYIVNTSGSYYLIATDVDGCWHRSFNLYCTPLFSSLAKEEIYEYEIYPNPAKDYLIIWTNSRENSILYLYDNLGSLHKTALINNDYRLDISDLEPGIYYLKINNTSQFAKKIIVAE
ncbi:MAG: T9SS type A sorting domain-containing protein [Bacteroidales bacterium]|nr:T9SS type A sorting domain-containing protein [Bacteroidales bacterium]